MNTLRLTQGTASGKNRYPILVEFEGLDLPRQTVNVEVKFSLSEQEQEDIRWYLEDYLSNQQDPNPEIAKRIEQRMADIGTGLFIDIFQFNDDSRNIWAALRNVVGKTRVEIVSTTKEAVTIPWELLRDPATNNPLALSAQSFVRSHTQTAVKRELPEVGDGPIRILLVICRPRGGKDITFRSEAIRLLKSLSGRDDFRLDLLRPPTFAKLSELLRMAKANDEPYHLVHFDGHGDFMDVEAIGLESLLVSPLRKGSHGYLVFENSEVKENMQLVDGNIFGQLMVECQVKVLLLNACLSAHSDGGGSAKQKNKKDEKTDLHNYIRAFGTLAQEVVDQGVPGVVANRYSINVDTAAQFIGDLYLALANGQTLGEAVTLGRKQLAAKPSRASAYGPVNLQDWVVPVVYEAAPIKLFPKKEKTGEIKIELKDQTPTSQNLFNLPPSPDAGFFGRDETLLALDRAFDTQKIVLLHAYAGSGKTTASAEFARWYGLTGGVKDGVVLFTKFENYTPLNRALDIVGQVFGQMLEKTNINWQTLDDKKRREVTLEVFKQMPVLWIWDNVEQVAGFPAGTKSKWPDDEQDELADFLRAAKETKAKFLLTSRRDERKWLEGLPARRQVPPMPMQERAELAKAIAEKHGHKFMEVEDWRPLLEFTRGNPMAITVLVGQAFKDGLKTKEQIIDFVEKLRKGEAEFTDEEEQGRSKSLGASLSYGFEHAFNEYERKVLALLHFFQGFVDVDTLKLMGDSKADWHLDELNRLTRENGIKMLDRASEVGLLTALGSGDYSIHPAVPWYFRSMFDKFYKGENRGKAGRAFVEAVGEMGSYYNRQYNEGNREAIGFLGAEEANLLHARRMARENGWWRRVISTMQGLDTLYRHTERRAEWKRLVDEILPDFIDPKTDGPLPGLEEEWGLVTDYSVKLAREARQWKEAERLQKVCVDFDRNRAVDLLKISPDKLDDVQLNSVRSLAVSLHTLAQIQREQGRKECVDAYKESLSISEKIGDKAIDAICAFNLGHAYKNIKNIRNLDKAEEWYRKSLELCAEGDSLGRAKSLAQLGSVSYERFKNARKEGKPDEAIFGHLNKAGKLSHEALELTPVSAVGAMAVTHNQLGNIYKDAGDIDGALKHYGESIKYKEASDNIYGAALTRFNVSNALRGVGRLKDAHDYANAALRNYEGFGDRAADKIQKTKELIAKIKEDLNKQTKK